MGERKRNVNPRGIVNAAESHSSVGSLRNMSERPRRKEANGGHRHGSHQEQHGGRPRWRSHVQGVAREGKGEVQQARAHQGDVRESKHPALPGVVAAQPCLAVEEDADGRPGHEPDEDRDPACEEIHRRHGAL